MNKPIELHVVTYNKNPREIEFGPLQTIINKYLQRDVHFVVYKLSYAGKYIIIKGKSLAGSLIILVDTLNSFKKKNKERFADHLYTHWYNHINKNDSGRFTVKVIAKIDKKTTYIDLLKIEQQELEGARYDTNCLNNQIEAYIPKYNETTGMYGWLPATDVMNFKKWLNSPR